jgi:hypothetical protein
MANLLAGGVLGLTLLAGIPASAQEDFPPISDADRAFTSVDFDPSATAVVLSETVDVRMRGAPGNETHTRWIVEGRIKILRADAEPFELEIELGRERRLADFRARTVWPDATVVPLPVGAVREEASGWRAHRVAFPAAAVGSFLDYRYELRADAEWILEPWLFQGRRPVLRSEVRVTVPKTLEATAWARESPGVPVAIATVRGVRGTEVTASVERAPAIPREAGAPPLADLSSRFVVVPTMRVQGRRTRMLFDSWQTIAGHLDEWAYSPVRRSAEAVSRRARELSGGHQPGSRNQAMALYQFVRDEIGTDAIYGLWVYNDGTLDDFLRVGKADVSGKALMLEAMLEAVGFEADIVWVSNRFSGVPDLTLPNPGWFDQIVVRTKVGGELVFLDPSRPWLPFGRLAAGFDGTPALVHHYRVPEAITLPESRPSDNERRATLDYVVAEDGAVALEVRLDFLGHSAEPWHQLAEAARLRGLAELLQRTFPEFSDLSPELVPVIEPGAVSVVARGRRTTGVPRRDVWVSLQLPYRFWLPIRADPAQRKTPVLLAHPEQDQLEVRVRYPAGWRVENPPADHVTANAVGGATTTFEPGADGHSFTYRFSRHVRGRFHSSRGALAALYELERLGREADSRGVALQAP